MPLQPYVMAHHMVAGPVTVTFNTDDEGLVHWSTHTNGGVKILDGITTLTYLAAVKVEICSKLTTFLSIRINNDFTQ